MERFTEVVLRHRPAVTLLWLALLVSGLATAGQLSDRLSFDFSLPGQPSYETELQLLTTYAAGTAVVVLGLLIGPVFDVRIGQSRVDSLSSSGTAFDTVTQLRQGGVVPAYSHPSKCWYPLTAPRPR